MQNLPELLRKQFPRELARNKRKLHKLFGNPSLQEEFLGHIAKITNVVSNPKVRASFFRSYLRIYANGINKDGRKGSVIMEITKHCNQRCKYCYSWAEREKNMRMHTINKIIKLVEKEYRHIFITGGEPTLDKRIFSIANAYPDIIFFMFTNGSFINNEYAKKLAQAGNLIPILSIDGHSQRMHDSSKGRGSFKRVMRAIGFLNKVDMPWGYLSMVTNLNAREVLSKEFVKAMRSKGAILARYLEFMPVGSKAKANLIPSAQTYYLMEKRKQEIINNGEIYMQDTSQKKCQGMVFFDVDGNIKCCPFFHYYKHNVADGDIGNLIKDSIRDWCAARYLGECPIYSDQKGFKNHLQSRSWKPTISFNKDNSTSPELVSVMANNYKAFLKIKTDRGL